MKLLIAVPAYESVRVEFFRSILELEKNLRENGVRYEIKPISGTLVHIARDRLASHAIKNGFDEVLWIDSDMVFDGHIYEDLKMVNKDIVCGWFISRHYPYVSCLFSSISPVERINEVPDEAFRVKACGFGCVLMKTVVLERVMNAHGGKCFIPDQKLGEDIAFCKRADDCGFEIWCEPTARVGHVGPVTIWPEDQKRLQGDIQNETGLMLE